MMFAVDHGAFHRFLLLTEKPARWSAWRIAPIPVGMAALAGWLWARAAGTPSLGWIVGLTLAVFLLLDLGLFWLLPRVGRSYGAIQPPFLAMVMLRGTLALVGIPLAGTWPWPILAGLVLIQALICTLLICGTWVEPFRLQITQIEIPTSKLPSSARRLRIVQLSDLHVERLTPREQTLLGLIERLAPDLIVLTGDYLSTSFTHDEQALSDLRFLLTQLSAPGGIYAVWGTAEVDHPEELRPIFRDVGISILEDQAVKVSVAGHRLWLVGLPCSRDLEGDGALLRALLSRLPSEDLITLLYHTPDLMPQAAAEGVDLYLAGHTHGGQWRLPGFGAILTSSEYGKRYEGGSYREGGTRLYVSRGLGMEGFGTPRARFFCPPEVVCLDLSGPVENKGQA